MKKTLFSERIIIREIKENDVHEIFQYLQEKKIKKFTNLSKTISDLTNKIKKTILDEKKLKRVIILGETNKIIGSITIKNIDTKNKKTTVGYRIGKKYEGKGLMKESMILLLKHLFFDLKLDRIEAWIRTDNFGSIKLVENLGFQKEGTARKYKKIKNKYHDFHLYGLLKSDFIKHSS